MSDKYTIHNDAALHVFTLLLPAGLRGRKFFCKFEVFQYPLEVYQTVH